MNQKSMYYIIRSVMGLSLNMVFTASALFFIDIAKLEVYQLILTGTALELAIFFFETPTGVVADLKSRRLSVIIGLFIIGIGFFIEAFTTYFIVIFASQIIWGLGYTFISGALDSWISDETNNKDIEKTVLTATQYNKGFGFIGIILAGVIGMINIRLAIYISGGLFILIGMFSIVYMKEENFQKTEHNQGVLRDYLRQLTIGFKHIRTSKILRYMFVAMLFFGLYSEGIDRTFEIQILDGLGFRDMIDINPVWIIAFVLGFIELSGLFILAIVKKYAKTGKHITLWAVNFTGMMMIGLLIYTYTKDPILALIGFLFFHFTREGTFPLLNTILLKNTPSNIKATVLSTFGQLDAIGQLLSGAIMVSVSLYFGLQNMLLVSTLLLIVPFIALIGTRNQH